jgi:hypothetical protein
LLATDALNFCAQQCEILLCAICVLLHCNVSFIQFQLLTRGYLMYKVIVAALISALCITVPVTAVQAADGVSKTAVKKSAVKKSVAKKGAVKKFVANRVKRASVRRPATVEAPDRHGAPRGHRARQEARRLPACADLPRLPYRWSPRVRRWATWPA